MQLSVHHDRMVTMAGEPPQPPAGHEQDGFWGLRQYHNVENHMYPLQDFYYNERPQKQIRELIFG